MAIDPKEFQKIFTEFEKIKDCYAVGHYEFYAKRVDGKRKGAQRAGWAILIISLAIPLVSNLPSYKIAFPDVILDNAPFIVSFMSLIIALISGLEGLHQWRKTWHDYSIAIIDIETLIYLWDIEVAAARQLSDPKEVAEKLKEATRNLVRQVEFTVEAEMGGFFAARNKAQTQQRNGATNDNV